MIERTLRFHDVTAGQAMTPRGEVIALPASADADEVLRVIEDSGHSRIPVYEETLDRVIGVLYARDLFRYVGKRLNGHDSDDGQTRAFTLAEIVRKPLVVPETKKLSDLLREIQLQKIHIAIVLDEYGGTSGLVTIEDVLEELVGEIADEHEDDEAPLFDRIDDRHAEADARIEVEEINRLMGLGLPEEDGFETLGGYVTTTLGRIPSPGTTFEHRHNGSRVLFTVLDAEPHRVNRLSVELAAAEESPGDPEASGDSKQG
jgi:CBS domain containing-hemolysin-like protein